MNGNEGLTADRRWQELCTHIRTTDEISFKLLGLVPLISIAAIGVTLLKGAAFTPVLVLLSLFAAAMTTAIWIWERRNIQTCLWLTERAAELERQPAGSTEPGHFYRFPAQGPGGKGKRSAEKFLYGVTIASWLLLPAAVFATRPPHVDGWHTQLLCGAYAVAAIWLGWYAWSAINVAITAEPEELPKASAVQSPP